MNIVTVASTGHEALALADEVRPDVTLVDIDLNGERGLALVCRLVEDRGIDGQSVLLAAGR